MKKIACFISIAAMLMVSGCNHKDYLYRSGGEVNSFSVKELDTALEHEYLRYIDTDGSQASLRLLQEDLLDFAVVRNDILNEANELRNKKGEKILYAAVANVSDETCYLVVRQDSDIRNVFDLKGRRVAVGRKEHGTLSIAADLFSAHGFRESLITPVYAPYRESSQMLVAGEIDALFCVDSYPSPELMALQEKIPIRLIPLDDDAEKILLNYSRGYILRQIPKGFLEGQDNDVSALRVNTVLVAHQNVPDEIIEKIILKLASYNASKSDNTDKGKVTETKLTEQLSQLCKDEYSLSFHPGAAKLYNDHGIKVKTFKKNVATKTRLFGQD